MTLGLKDLISPSVILGWALLAYVAILPASGTIALRHLFMAVGLLSVLVIGLQSPRKSLLSEFKRMPLAWSQLFFWWIFLLIFPLVSAHQTVAFASFINDWLMAICAGVIGLICGISHRSYRPNLGTLSIASMSLVFVYSLLTLFNWSGLLGNDVPLVLSWTEIWQALQKQLQSDTPFWFDANIFRGRFHGFDHDHGNLGLSATQSMALLLPVLMAAWVEGKIWRAGLATIGLLLCLASVLLAMSRGALLMSVIIIVFGILIFIGVQKNKISVKLLAINALLLFSSVVLVVAAAQRDSRWSLLSDKFKATLLVEDPVQFFCTGLTPELEQKIRSSFDSSDPNRIDAIISGMVGDGGRLQAARAGLSFVLDHPAGLDGSRHIFKNLIQQSCGDVPKIEFAHTHNGWLDLFLALGWTGGLLYSSVLIFMLVWGGKQLLQKPSNPWCLALVLTLIFWLLRGFIDSVYREHALLMQAVMMTYLAARVWRPDDAL